MKSVQIVAIGAPLEGREMPDPSPGPGDVIVRITTAGICHSDVHYRDGVSSVKAVPITPGHEIAGVIEDGPRAGERVCIHYLVTCGDCDYCRTGREQWCLSAEMIGKDRDGGYAEYIAVPGRNAIQVPEKVGDSQAAVMMCSSATSLHAFRKARFRDGESVAIIGCGGLGLSAIRIARILGASEVIGVDVNPEKLVLADLHGATPVDAAAGDPVDAIREITGGRGADVVLELVGSTVTVRQSILAAAVQGRIALVGIANEEVSFNPYTEVIGRETEIIGVSDHHADDLRLLLGWAAEGRFDLSGIVTEAIPLEPASVNDVLDRLARGGAAPRTVIQPGQVGR